MPRTKTNKGKKAHTGTEEVLDSFESWLKRQRPKDVKAKSGFISSQEA